MAVGLFVTPKSVSLVATLNQKANRFWSKNLSIADSPSDIIDDNKLLQELLDLKLQILFFEAI